MQKVVASTHPPNTSGRDPESAVDCTMTYNATNASVAGADGEGAFISCGKRETRKYV